MAKKKSLSVSGSQDLCGLGENLNKITDQDTGEILAYIGLVKQEKKIHLTKPISFDQFDSINELLNKKKLNKFLDEQDFDKIQNFVDKKFK